MKINSYQVGMDSERTYRSSQTRKFSLGIAKQRFISILDESTDSNTGVSYRMPNGEKRNDDNTTKEYGSSLRDAYENMSTPLSKRIREVQSNDLHKDLDQVRQRFVLYLWQIFFGKDKSRELSSEMGLDETNNNQFNNSEVGMTSLSTITIDGVREISYSESEELSFTSFGNIKTEDGREIEFNLNTQMSRSFSAYYREEGIPVARAMCDPLVLNFSGELPDLSDTTFFFDLDADGEQEEISTLTSGNGFLALDRNEDGIINDGSELFGTSSGDGFKDLSKYDSDGNGWIDENDSIYNLLKIWIKDSDGNDKLYSLKEKNVGAIYLGNADTDYTLRSDSSGTINGAIKKSGIFLYEDGSGVGTVSHLDIAN